MELKERQERATEKVKRLISFGFMKLSIQKRLSLNPRTLEVRLKMNNWKLPEIESIENMKFE